MYLQVLYTDNIFITVELYDTPAVNKWLYIFNHINPKVEYTSSYIPINKYPGNQGSISEKNKVVENINKNIELFNDSIILKKFPYSAKLNMTWEDIQNIHRSFTTSELSQRSFSYNFTKEELIELKYTDAKEIKNILNTRCNKDFKIKNKENFKKYAEYINKSIHEYEKFVKSEQSCDLGKLFPTNASIFTNAFRKENIKGSFITLTLDEIKESCKPGWGYGTNVFLHSNIIGKNYIDTFLQDQKGLEVDVRNIENIGGDFVTFAGGKQSTYEFFNNSPFSLWCDSLNLPRYLTHPIPLGKIVKHSSGFFKEKQLSKKINNAETTKVRISWEEYDNRF